MVTQRHRRSIRLTGYDYRATGAYFVTIVAYGRQCLFDELLLRETVERVWASVVCRGDAPSPCDFVVMPNHVHGIIWLDRDVVRAQHQMTASLRDRPWDTHHHAITAPPHGAAPLRPVTPGATPKRPAICGVAPVRSTIPHVAPGSLGAVVRAFKGRSTKLVNRLRATPVAPVWQRNYFERIIRNEDELARIREYVLDNPRRWEDDPNHPNNAAPPHSPR